MKPADLRIDVRNGSGVPGLGAKVADLLERAGYVINSVGNADSFDYDTTQIRAYVEDAARRRARAERYPSRSGDGYADPRSDARRDDGDSGKAPALADVTVVVGRDYVNVPASGFVAEVTRLARVAIVAHRRRWFDLWGLSRVPAVAAAAAGGRHA